MLSHFYWTAIWFGPGHWTKQEPLAASLQGPQGSRLSGWFSRLFKLNVKHKMALYLKASGELKQYCIVVLGTLTISGSFLPGFLIQFLIVCCLSHTHTKPQGSSLDIYRYFLYFEDFPWKRLLHAPKIPNFPHPCPTGVLCKNYFEIVVTGVKWYLHLIQAVPTAYSLLQVMIRLEKLLAWDMVNSFLFFVFDADSFG